MINNKDRKGEEKEKNAVEKVANMNRVFDKYIVPILIFCVIAAVLSSLVTGDACVGKTVSGMLRDDGAEDYSGSVSPADTTADEADFYERRSGFMAAMESNSAKLESAGFTISYDYSQSAAAVYRYSDRFYSVDYFENPYGAFSIIVSRPTENEYPALKMIVYGSSLIIVVADIDESTSHTASFSSEDFSSATDTTQTEAQFIIERFGKEVLTQMLAEYKTAVEKAMA